MSYASQDADAARRICEALRSGGVEVWFDADGGLEHGDEWDAKIRRQIKDCVLFIPVISANTQARHEGYFRIEWDLAAERARGIASGVPFILPVVIDDTREPDALVPDRFRVVQWTRLRGGEVPPEVKARYLKLWSHRTGVLSHEAAAAGPRESLAPGVPARPRRSPGLWLGAGIALAAVVIAASVLVFQGRKTPLPLEAPARGGLAGGTVAAVNEIDQFVKQAREIIYDPDSGRTEFALAENFLKRATDLAPASGAAWGASALLQHYFYSRAYDVNKQRLVRSQAEAEKTLRLDPDNTDALLALGLHRQLLGERERARNYLERARAADPQNSRAILALSAQVRGLSARAKFMLDAAAGVARPAEIYYDASLLYLNLRRFDEAARALDRAITAQPFWRTFVMRANIEKLQSADPARINAWLDRVPELKRDEPRVVLLRYNAAMLRRDHAAAVRVLSGVAVGYFEDNFFLGPKAYLLAPAYELAGQRERAAEQWQLAERSLREKVLTDPQRTVWRPMLAVTLAAQGLTTEARSAVDSCAGDERVMSEVKSIEYTAEAFLRLGRSARAIELLQTAAGKHGWHFVSAATLGADPRWDPLRSLPEYGALLAMLKRAETDDTAPSLTSAAAPDPKSVAVLAFANLSDDKSNEYLSDGISEGLINVLGRVPGLTVRGRTSAFYFKGRTVSTEEIAQRLNVAYLVRGSVQKLGSRVRITAELTRAATDEVMWTSEPLDRDVKDIFAVQDEIAGLIAKNLKVTLGHGAAPTRQVDPEAHRLYLEGRHFWSQRTEEGFDRAERAFTQAVQRDPTFARAQAGLADLWAIRAWYNGEDGVGDVAALLVQAEAAAKRASELDPGLAEVHATFGAIRLVAGRIDEAKVEFERCIALAPNYATARNWRGELLLLRGRIDSALDDFTIAAQLDPLSPIMVNDCVRVLLAVGRPAEALAYAERVAAFSESATGIIYRAHALQELGRCDEAVAAIRALAPKLETTDGFRRRSARAVYVLQKCGREAEAVALADSLMRRVPADSFVRGFILGALGRFDEAIPLLANMPVMTTRILLWEPTFDPVRDDPRLQQVMVKLGCAAENQVARETLRRLRSETGARK